MSEPSQAEVLQNISDDWKNRDKSEGDPNTRSEEPEDTAVAADPAKTAKRTSAPKAAPEKG